MVAWWVVANAAGGLVGGFLAVLVFAFGVLGLGAIGLITMGSVDRVLIFGIWFLIVSGILGLLVAGILGGFQGWVLQRYIRDPFRTNWLRATCVGGSIGALIFGASVLLTTMMGDGRGPVAFITTMTSHSFPTATDQRIIEVNALAWLVGSLSLTCAQWTALRHYVQGTAKWILVSIVGWSLGGYMAAFAAVQLIRIEFPPYTPGSAFDLVYGSLFLVVTVLPAMVSSIVTGSVLLWLLRDPQPTAD
ncbi:MAG: hypothetical protein ACR2M0_13855 [Chloroflexia bacterium]